MTSAPARRPTPVVASQPPHAAARGCIAVSIPRTALLAGGLAVLAGDAVFVAMTLLSDLGVDFGGAAALAREFDLKLEGNLAAWYSSALLLVTGLGAMGVGQRMRRAGGSRPAWVLWWVAAAFFVGLSADEVAQLHERVGRAFARHVGPVRGLTDGASAVFAWLVALAPLIALFVGSMLFAARSIGAVDPRGRTLVLAGLGCWIAVLVAEYVQAQLVRAGIERSLQGAIEEGLELAGTTLFLFAFASICARRHPDAAPAVRAPR